MGHTHGQRQRFSEDEAAWSMWKIPGLKKRVQYIEAKDVLRVIPPASASHVLGLQVCVTMPGLSFPLSHPHILPWIGEHNCDTSSQICLFWTLPQSSGATLPTKYLVLSLQISCSNQLYRARRHNLSPHLPRSFPSPGAHPQLTLSPPRLESKVETQTVLFLWSSSTSSTTSNWLSEPDKDASTN